jgi:hypothetical protein
MNMLLKEDRMWLMSGMVTNKNELFGWCLTLLYAESDDIILRTERSHYIASQNS